MRATRSASNSSTPSMPQHVRDEVVGEQRQPVEVVAGGEPWQREVGGGDLRALEERDLVAVVGRDVVPGRPSSRARRELLDGVVGAGEARGRAVDLARRSSFRWRAKWPISSCSGSWPKRLGDLVARERVELGRPSTARGAAGRPPSCGTRTARCGLRSVGNQPEPKLIAFSCRLNAARVSSSAPSRSGAGGDSRRSVARVGLDRVLARCARAVPRRRHARPRRRGCRRSASRGATLAHDARRPRRSALRVGHRSRPSSPSASVERGCPPTPPSTTSSRASTRPSATP